VLAQLDKPGFSFPFRGKIVGFELKAHFFQCLSTEDQKRPKAADGVFDAAFLHIVTKVTQRQINEVLEVGSGPLTKSFRDPFQDENS